MRESINGIARPKLQLILGASKEQRAELVERAERLAADVRNLKRTRRRGLENAAVQASYGSKSRDLKALCWLRHINWQATRLLQPRKAELRELKAATRRPKMRLITGGSEPA